MSNSLFKQNGDYIQHPHVKRDKVEYREYQSQIAERASEESSLIALPTGTGKTVIAALIAAQRTTESDKPILFLAPNKPLVSQQHESFMELLSGEKEAFLQVTGDTSPDTREKIWGKLEADYVFATPQIIENDIIAGRLDISQFSSVFFDECHKATGNYAYTFIADQYIDETTASERLVTGMSASPGSSEDDILKLCDRLNIKNVEIMGEDDELLQEHLHTPDVEQKWVELDDEILEIRDLLEKTAQERYKELEEMGFLSSSRKNLSFGELRQARSEIQKEKESPDGDTEKAYSAFSVHAEAMKLHHAVKLIDTQGVNSIKSYLEEQKNEARKSDASKAVKRMCKRKNIRKALRKAKEYDQTHPKKTVLRMYLIDTVTEGGQMILFTEYLDTASELTDFINSHDGISAKKFTGQSQMSQKQQQQVLDEFRNNGFDVLVSTSVGEEGLDIPDASMVVFYEPVSQGIRSIQRRGRTARESYGKVVILIGEGTRDEGFHYASQAQEDKMKENLNKLSESQDSIQDVIKEKLYDEDETEEEQKDLLSFEDTEDNESTTEADTSNSESESDSDEEGIVVDDDTFDSPDDSDRATIIADSREMKSTVVQDLYKAEDVDLETETLDVGDFVIGPETVVERKEISDFVSTITGDRSLFEQVGNMTDSYDRSIILIEGNPQELYSQGVHPNAIRATLDSVVGDFNLDIFYASDESDTANWLQTLAKRSQDDSESTVSSHGNKKTQTITDQQEYIVSSVGDVGPVSAKALLKHFGSVREVFNADQDELEEVDGVGPKTAEKITTVLSETYNPDN